MDPYKFKVTQLREQLQKRQLSTAGSKSELVVRLQEANPEGHWMQELEASAALASGENAREENFLATPTTSQEEALRSVPALPITSQEETLRELEWLRREQRIMERELRLAERENQMLRNSENVRENRPEPHVKVNIKAVSELLSEFDGSEGLFQNW